MLKYLQEEEEAANLNRFAKKTRPDHYQVRVIFAPSQKYTSSLRKSGPRENAQGSPLYSMRRASPRQVMDSCLKPGYVWNISFRIPLQSLCGRC